MNSTTCPLPLIADRVLPQRDLLLDREFMSELFSRQLGVNCPIVIESCEHIRTTYHAGESLRVAYRVSASEGSCVVAGRAFPEGRSGKSFEAARQKAVNCGPFRPVFHDTETESIFWTFPNDRKIANLNSLVQIPQELAQLFAAPWARSNIVAYAPENCATAQCLTAQGDVLAYAKVYADDHNEICLRTYTALRQSVEAERTEIEFPKVIYHSAKNHILVLRRCGASAWLKSRAAHCLQHLRVWARLWLACMQCLRHRICPTSRDLPIHTCNWRPSVLDW